MLKKKAIFFIVLLITTIIAAGAITSFFTTQTVTSQFGKKTFFNIVFNCEFPTVDIGPGEEVAVNPVVYSNATEDMFVFIRVDMPKFDGEDLYDYTVDDCWTLVEDGERKVYAYGSEDEMIVLAPGDETTPLTRRMVMKDVTIPGYSFIDDINVSFQVFALGAKGTSIIPAEAWNEAQVYVNDI